MINISVIIPSYKPQSYIYECLLSLNEQTYSKKFFEVIIILNGCNEPYKSNIINYIKENLAEMNIQLFQTDIPGVSNARNIGLNNSQGQYICFIDDDDVISPNYLCGLIKKANQDTIVISNVLSFKYNINEKRKNFFICKKLRHKEKYINASLFINRSFLAFPVAKIIHKHIIGNRRFDNRFKNGEDALFMTSISNKIKNICFTEDDSIYYVRERIGSASRRKFHALSLTIETMQLLNAYIKTYFKQPSSYNLLLFLSRIPGVIKGAINLYIKGKFF